MGNYTKSKKAIVIIGYVLAGILFIQFIGQLVETIISIHDYQMFGDVPFMQAVMYIFQSMSILMQSVLLAIVTRIAQFILPDRDASQEFKAMTVTELADELQINRDRIYRYCRQAGITEKHVGEIPMLLSKKEVAAVRKEFGER